MIQKWTTLSISMLFILLLIPARGLDYTKEHSLACSQISDVTGNFEQTLPQLWNILILHIIDKYVFLIGCPIILFVQIMVQVTYFKNRHLLSKPGNIYCGLVVIETCLNLHLYSNAVYRTIYGIGQPMPSSFIGFCESMGIYSAFFSLLHFMYLMMFMFYIIFIFRFSLKKKSDLFWGALNFFVVLISLMATALLYLFKFIGLNFYGLCGLTVTRRMDWNSPLPAIQIAFALIFLIFGIFTFLYFRKHMPGGELFRKRKAEQTKIIFMYVTGFSILQILMSSMNLILDENCRRSQPIPQLNIFITTTNILRLVQFCFLIFLIMYNLKFRQKFKYTFKRLFHFFTKNKNSKPKQLADQYKIEDVFFDERLLEMKQNSNQIDLLLLSQVYTIISGVYIAYFEYFGCENSKQQLRSIKFRENIVFSIDNSSIMAYETQARLLIKLRILPCNIAIHCPDVFRDLLAKEGLSKVFDSFKIVDNSTKLSNLAEGTGGRSGQFFFFSSDNRYVLKTITVQQFQFYSEHLQAFHDYYNKNPHSLLARIIGLFTIKGDQMQRTYRLILMKNILGCKKNQIMKLYDLKGSKYDRQVLFEEVQKNQISKMTLKDIDFINFEKNLKLTDKFSRELRQILQKDSTFLRNFNLLDYSLLIVKVKWDQPPAEPNFWSKYQRLPNEQSENQYYHIGVIDYMQKWDFQKRSEKRWKKLLGKKDFSAEQPHRYQIRFMQFVDEITANGIKDINQSPKFHFMTELRDIRTASEPNMSNDVDQSLEPCPNNQQRNTGL